MYFPLSYSVILNGNQLIWVLIFRWQCLLPECLSHRTWWQLIPRTWWVRLLPRTNSCPKTSSQHPLELWMWTMWAWVSQQPRPGWHRWDGFSKMYLLLIVLLWLIYLCLLICIPISMVWCSHPNFGGSWVTSAFFWSSYTTSRHLLMGAQRPAIPDLNAFKMHVMRFLGEISEISLWDAYEHMFCLCVDRSS